MNHIIIIIFIIFVEVLWYIGVNPWLWIKGLRVPFPSMPGTFVLQQDTLSTLLLSTQVYKRVPGRMWRICCVNYAFAWTPRKAARQGMFHWEWNLCTLSAVLKLYPTTGVIIVWCALNTLAGCICAHYKCSYYYYQHHDLHHHDNHHHHHH